MLNASMKWKMNKQKEIVIIERNKTFNNLILATGHDMLGMTHSLITGKLVSEIIPQLIVNKMKNGGNLLKNIPFLY